MSLRLLNAVTATSAVPANVAATATIVTPGGASLLNNETFTIRRIADGLTVVFTFDTASRTSTPAIVYIPFTGAESATAMGDLIVTALAASILGITGVNTAGSVVVTASLTGPDQNATITETVVNASFTVTNLVGGAWAGISLHGQQPGVANTLWLKGWDAGVIEGRSVAGSGDMTFQGRLWLMNPITRTWSVPGIGTVAAPVADRGKLNDGVTQAEDGTDVIMFNEPIYGLTAFSRIYLQVTTIAGTGTAITAWLVPRSVNA